MSKELENTYSKLVTMLAIMNAQLPNEAWSKEELLNYIDKQQEVISSKRQFLYRAYELFRKAGSLKVSWNQNLDPLRLEKLHYVDLTEDEYELFTWFRRELKAEVF